VILLFLAANAAAFMLIPTSAGGSPSTQTGMGVLAGITTLSIIFAYISIKRLRIDLHRAWMLRTWVYAGSIISIRLISAAGMHYIGINQDQHFFDIQSCAQIWYQYALFGVNMEGPGNPVPFLYPQCQTANASIPVLVKANPYSGQPETLTATMNILFGMSLWLALAIHAFGVELYLWLTPAETERLRMVSYERQVEAGMRERIPHSAVAAEHQTQDNVVIEGKEYGRVPAVGTVDAAAPPAQAPLLYRPEYQYGN
jgi:hypothetical protein